jgi:hypothetical protein
LGHWLGESGKQWSPRCRTLESVSQSQGRLSG